MANHSLPAITSTYTNYTTELNARIDDAGKWNSSTLTTATNLPTDTVRWNTTNLYWERNTGTAGTPVWAALSTSYSLNINGTVGATTPNTGAFTTLSASSTVSGTGFSTYLASPPAIGGTTACSAGTFTALTVNTTCTLPAAATVTGNGTIVGTTATQTLTNKTLTTPTISSIINTGTLTLPTATTTLVGTDTTDTLSNKTLTAPKFASAGFIADSNGNEQLAFTTTASAITYLNITNGATGVAPSITAAGETNTSLNLKSTGTGTVQANGIVLADLSSTQALSNKTLTASAFNGTIGATTPSTVACTTLDVSTSVSGTGFSTLFAAPGSIGTTTAAAGAFTTLSASTSITWPGGGSSGVASTGDVYCRRAAAPTTGVYYFVDSTHYLFWNATNFSLTDSLVVTGNITAYSDRRLKKDLTVIPNALDKVGKLTGYNFTRTDTGERHTGLIAQDVQAVMPEAVLENEGQLALAYGNLVGLLVEAIKELKQEVDGLK